MQKEQIESNVEPLRKFLEASGFKFSRIEKELGLYNMAIRKFCNGTSLALDRVEKIITWAERWGYKRK